MTESETETMPAPMASLFVGDLHSDVTEAHLHAAFSEFKSLASVHVCKDSVTGKSLCYGYVNLTSRQEGNGFSFHFISDFSFQFIRLINLSLFLRFES